MGSAFDTLHAEALDDVILPQFAETVIYTPKNGTAVSISAIVIRDPVDGAATDRGATTRRPRELVVSITDVATPNSGGDTFGIKPMASDTTNVTYRLGGIAEQHAGGWRLLLS